ncbi:MAG: 7TM-DISM domain-containing protein [Aquabacterium sp.]|nr:7TM-DISM domain-containing protein [Aquabacterium sp.]
MTRLHAWQRLLRHGLVLCTLLLAAVLPARAADMVQARAVLQDPAGSLTIAQVLQSDFQPSHYLLNLGHTKSVVWLRLQLLVPEPEPATQVNLRLSPTTMDAVQVFVATPGRALAAPIMLTSRDQLASTALALPPGRHTVYLRLVQQRGLMLLTVRALGTDDSQAYESLQQRLHGALTLLGLAGVLLAAWLGLQHRALLYAAVALNLLMILLQTQVHLNLQPDWLAPGLLDSRWLNRLMSLLTPCSASWAFVAIAVHFRLPRLMLRLTQAMAGLGSLTVLAYVASGSGQLMALGFAGLSAYTFLFHIGLGIHFVRRYPNLLSVALALVLMVVSTVITALSLSDNRALHDLLAVDLFLVRGALMPGFIAWLLMISEVERARQREQALQDRDQARAQAALEQQRRELQSYFMSMLTHELKSPLSTIQIATATLAHGADGNASDLQRLRNIDKSVDDINYVLERCVEIEEDADQHLEPSLVLLRVAHLLRDTVNSLDHARIQIQCAEAAMLQADPQFLGIILRNLLSNALKYSPPGSQVVLQAERQPDPGAPGLRFGVRSQVGASGVPERSRLFKRYYRAEGAKKLPGAGLGLWLSQALAHKIGTTIDMQIEHDHIEFSFIVRTPA